MACSATASHAGQRLGAAVLISCARSFKQPVYLENVLHSLRGLTGV